jgi:hypothetical protein
MIGAVNSERHKGDHFGACSICSLLQVIVRYLKYGIGVRFGFARKVYFTRMGTNALATHFTSVADPGCSFRILIFFSSRILIFFSSRIPDLTKTKKRRGKNMLSYLFCSPMFQEIVKYLIFSASTVKVFSQLTKNIRFL